MEEISLQPSTVKIEAFEQNNAGQIVLVATITVTCPTAK
jgi:hypothetical protein